MQMPIGFLLISILFGIYSNALAQSLLADPARIEADRLRSARLAPAEREGARVLFDQAFSLFQAGDFESARIGFERGLGIDPANGPANYYLGELLVRRKDYDAARERFSRTLKLAPDSAEGLKAQAALGKLGPWPMLAERLKGKWCTFKYGTRIPALSMTFHFNHDGKPSGYTFIGSSGSPSRPQYNNIRRLEIVNGGDGFLVHYLNPQNPNTVIEKFWLAGEALNEISCTSDYVALCEYTKKWERCE